MTTPAVVHVGHLTYSVVTSEDAWKALGPEDETRMANTDHVAQVITIRPGVSRAMERMLLWHETLHAAFYAVLGQPDWTDLGANSFDREEAVVRRIEFAILDVLRQNPGLVSFLTLPAS